MAPVVGSVIRFSNAHTTIDVTIDQDNPAVRSLIGQLPLTGLPFSDNQGLEKLARLSEELSTTGSPASGVRAGDLICFSPWNSIAFWYDPDGYHVEPELIHLGRYLATAYQLEKLEAAPVAVQLVNPRPPSRSPDRHWSLCASHR
ncbi:cyclophilin-like fold protein [Rhodococcus sp. T2V]|uniref:cyclophilin-like fold protein n=1 Tax=Rhodococcus sp. T2V TaxID=3034164 RepID=UPI0023E2F994|nr:cyclophilin-like fold protein [Rhodococcus sp. T2V]MDF3309696.1 cyclophilin-like fold protein [Rhodococcus sp. T2V]